MIRRLAILVLGTLFLGLVAEGVLSLGFQRSLAELWRGRDDELLKLLRQRPALEAALSEQASRTPGPYRVHEDPFVGYALKQDAVVEYAEKRVQTDALGLRVRPGPPLGPDPFRIVFLGDSVAFGHGLDDADVISAQVETILREVLPPGGREIACTSVAVPSWNYRNLARFLLDHLDVLDPDVVLYMDIDNDLDDSYAADEIGQRRLMQDPATPDPLLSFRANRPYYNRSVLRLREQRRPLEPATFGPQAQQAGLSYASIWRIEDMARRVAELARILEARGGHFALLPYVQHPTHRQVRARLARMGADVRSIPLLETIRDEETQGLDPHPNAQTERVLALWTAESLIELGWIPGTPVGAVPPVPAAFAGRRTRELDAEEVLAWSADFERAAREDLERVVDEDSLRGMLQIYGGLNVDGTFGPRLAAVLPPGRRLAVTLAPIAERADLYPLEIAVEVEGALLGTVPLDSADSGPVRRELELPAECAERPFEVLLKSDRWCIHRVLVVSARFGALESLE